MPNENGRIEVGDIVPQFDEAFLRDLEELRPIRQTGAERMLRVNHHMDVFQQQYNYIPAVTPRTKSEFDLEVSKDAKGYRVKVTRLSDSQCVDDYKVSTEVELQEAIQDTVQRYSIFKPNSLDLRRVLRNRNRTGHATRTERDMLRRDTMEDEVAEDNFTLDIDERISEREDIINSQRAPF